MFAGQITGDETLFVYPDGKNWTHYAFPNHSPIFSDELDPADFPLSVQQACGSDPICLFDAKETGNLQVGQQSTSLGNALVLTVMNAGELCVHSK